ncbi:MAG: DUF1360 domain-containing protein [Candidatus Doudnabacteria bacterium]
MNNKRIFGWLTLDMVIFVAVNIFLIANFGNRLSTLSNIGFFKLLVLGLAVYRAANILSNEVITKPLRSPFVDETEKNGKVVEIPKRSGALRAFGLLIYCPSCTGVWLAAAIVYAYIFWPTPTFVISMLLALSAIERIVSGILGWFRHNS